MKVLGSDYKGLIFDVDGTILDNMPTHYIAWKETCEKHGLHFSEKDFYAQAGVPTRTIVQRLCEAQNVTLDITIEEFSHEKEAAYFKLPAHHSPAVSKVTALIHEARKSNTPVALATGGTHVTVKHALEIVGLSPEDFNAIVTSHDVEHPKPAPDVFLAAARGIGVDPKGIIAFEDSDLGMEAIGAAGMVAVDVRPWVIEQREASQSEL
jgi:HAD superfamily hydrolase (TIGR01509 family)